MESRGQCVEPSAAIARYPVDPTGVGEAFGSASSRVFSMNSLEDSVRLGCVMSSLALDVVGTQEYVATPDEIVKRWSES